MDDLISRQAAIEHYNVVDPAGSFVYCDNIIKFLKSLPAVTPARPKGEWITNDEEFPGDWHCSRCGAIVEHFEQDYHNWYYCYHCGADMRGDSE